MAVVAALAVFHGHAHGSEMGGAGAVAYLGGFASATALLHAAGYPDFISGEWIGWEPPEMHLPRELATLKSYEPSGV